MLSLLGKHQTCRGVDLSAQHQPVGRETRTTVDGCAQCTRYLLQVLVPLVLVFTYITPDSVDQRSIVTLYLTVGGRTVRCGTGLMNFKNPAQLCKQLGLKTTPLIRKDLKGENESREEIVNRGMSSLLRRLRW
ncbi:hypothetical protein DPMN_087536 [Dreissena polymorpha]|uniref:Uncharacterized protein n=1 Tax=Dreissena polymorpha TaxID=45954 RepID=A0A9D4KUF2_DREPO|nr:hypothetical protein DPMN_087536 [Dreissena polymorpha]